MYTVIFSNSAEKKLKKLDKESRSRIISSLKRCRIRPHHYIKKLVGCPYFSLRTGDYRLILNIREDKLIILVVEVGHRRKVYKKY